MTITKKIEGKLATLTVEGRLDTITAPELDAVMTELVPSVDNIIVDFSQLIYCSSAGLRVLLGTHKALLGKGGKLVIRHANDTVSKVFTVTGLTGILNIEG